PAFILAVQLHEPVYASLLPTEEAGNAVILGDAGVGRNGSVEPEPHILFQYDVDNAARSLSGLAGGRICDHLHPLDQLCRNAPQALAPSSNQTGRAAVDQDPNPFTASQADIAFKVGSDGRNPVQDIERIATHARDILTDGEDAAVEIHPEHGALP